MRFRFMIKWPADTLSVEGVRLDLAGLGDDCYRFLQDAKPGSSDRLDWLMFTAETLSEGAGVCVEVKRWFEGRNILATFRIHELGFKVDFDLWEFLFHNLGWTALTVES